MHSSKQPALYHYILWKSGQGNCLSDRLECDMSGNRDEIPNATTKPPQCYSSYSVELGINAVSCLEDWRYNQCSTETMPSADCDRLRCALRNH
eukprot:58687-Amphidinium_carterae.1